MVAGGRKKAEKSVSASSANRSLNPTNGFFLSFYFKVNLSRHLQNKNQGSFRDVHIPKTLYGQYVLGFLPCLCHLTVYQSDLVSD